MCVADAAGKKRWERRPLPLRNKARLLYLWSSAERKTVLSMMRASGTVRMNSHRLRSRSSRLCGESRKSLSTPESLKSGSSLLLIWPVPKGSLFSL